MALWRGLAKPSRDAALVAGGLPVLAFPSLNLEFLGWCGIVPGLLLIHRSPSAREAAVRGWWFGTSADRGVRVIRLDLPPAAARTPYDEMGDYVPWTATAVALLSAIFALLRTGRPYRTIEILLEGNHRRARSVSIVGASPGSGSVPGTPTQAGMRSLPPERTDESSDGRASAPQVAR